MRETTITCSRYFLLCVGFLLIALLVFGFSMVMNWPWWVGISLLLILSGLFAGALFLRKLMLRRREQHFVQQLIEQEKLELENVPSENQKQMEELQNIWEEAVQTLRRSHLKKQGNPLYVLPWYLIMGETGSGKSTAISSARLSSPFAEVHQISGISGTRNCDWWFLDQAILIDTAGRYSMPVDSGRDNRQWQKFLSLLVKYRSREPINGLIITVSADKLLNGRQEDLENDGRQLRCRIDELMRVLGIRFPVYALVTKCDLIQGMTQFTDRLSEKSLDQPMGVCYEGLDGDVAVFLERVVVSVVERLKSLRILMLHQPHLGAVNSGVLLFPDEMEGLQPGFSAFMKAVFQENRYQDTPFLRGIYLCSGRQAGNTYSNILGDPSPISEKEMLPGTSRGFFLHDFFEKILLRDQGLLAPTTRTMERTTLTRNLGLASWVLLGIALSGLLSHSFVKNMATIREASTVTARTPELSGNFMADLADMDRFCQMIMNVEKKNRDWWIPRFGLNESSKVEMALKAKYCRQFQNRFLVSVDKNFSTLITGFSQTTPDEVRGRYTLHLCRRVNLLKARLSGAGLDALRARPLPCNVIPQLQQENDLEMTKKFGNLYINYLFWRTDTTELYKEVQQLQTWLKQMSVVKGGSLAWVIEFANRQGVGSSLTLQSFWGGSHSLPEEPSIAPAFTRKGKEYVYSLVNELSAAYPEPEVLEKEKTSFESCYRSSCFAAWQRLAVWLPRGEERLSGIKEWQNAAQVMATDQGPYFAFLKKAVTELEPFGIASGAPSWLSQAYRYQILKTAAPERDPAAYLAEEGKKIAGRLGRVAGKQGPGIGAVESRAAFGKAVQEYQGAMRQIAAVAKSRNLACQMALQVFTEDPGVCKSPFYQAADAVYRINRLLCRGRSDEIFSRLISSPISFFASFVRMETACSLQRQWEEKVLKEVQGATDAVTFAYLFGKEGPVWKFVSDSADPFIGWTPGRGYYSKVALGGSVPFEPGFYAFLTKGGRAKVAAVAAAPPKKSYNVTIKGLPIDANSDSRTKPQSTRLELQCAYGSQAIDNMNYPVSKTLVWSPEACSDVLLQIDIGDAILTKRYPGPQGFPEFLHDFPGGRHTFYPKEFPREQQALERMGLRFIRVNYQLSGGHDIRVEGQSKLQPGQVPAKIAKCWD